jgi:hypothetical protein
MATNRDLRKAGIELVLDADEQCARDYQMPGLLGKITLRAAQ